MSERRNMEPGDWLNAAVNVLIGLFLGVALNGLLQLFADGAWAVALVIAVMAFGAAVFLIFFDGLVGKLFERVFPSGVRPSHSPKAEDRKPIARLLSLPLGIFLGAILAGLGLTNAILGML